LTNIILKNREVCERLARILGCREARNFTKRVSIFRAGVSEW
jgi:hypothetical protein